MPRKRVAVLISGAGSNALALIAAARTPGYPAEIVLVLSNRPQAAGLAKAQAAGVAAVAVDHKLFGQDREAHERALNTALETAGAEFIALAGYMRVLTPWFVRTWAGRLINIHPSLLPAFPGLNTHQGVLDAGATKHGCSVHWVTEGVDQGPLIGQTELLVQPGDDAPHLAARVLAAEHDLYPRSLAGAITGSALIGDLRSEQRTCRRFGPGATCDPLARGFKCVPKG